MKDVKTLIEECRNLGATFTPLNNRIRVKAPQPLPDELMAELKEAKPEILAELHRQSKARSECWLLEEWRRISIPDWRRILNEAVKTHNTSREEYARWMLRDILEDPEYQERNDN